jgi:DNA polymerase-1
MNDFFRTIPKNANMKKINNYVDPILMPNENAEVVVLLEEPIFCKELTALKGFLNSNVKVPYSIISVLPYFFNENEDVKAIVKTYTKDAIKIEKYIKPGSKILCMGRAIYTISSSIDIGTETFTDIVFNSSYFYAPKLKSFVFPTFSYDKVVGKNSWEHFHALHQCKEVRGFKSILPRVPSLTSTIVLDIPAFYKKYKDEKIMAIDTETNGLDFTVNKVHCVTMAFSEYEGFYIPWKEVVKHGITHFADFIKDKYQIYANGKFDVKFFMKEGVERDALHIDFDTLNAGHILNEIRRNSLKSHAWIYTNYGGYDKELEDYKEKFSIMNYSKIPDSVLVPYATKDPMITFQTYLKMKKQIEAIDKKFPMENGWSLSRYYYEIVIPAVNMFCDIEYNGTYINIEKLTEEGIELKKKLEETEKEFLTYVGKTKEQLNINSFDDIGRILEERKLPLIERNKKGLYFSNDEVLEKYAKLGYKEAEILSRYRTLSTIHKTFIGDKTENTGFWQYLKYHDDGSIRVHSNFAVMLADSGRCKSKDPNMTNIPSHGEWAEFVRGHFAVPNDDYVFMSVDYSGLQMRLATIVSKDPELTDVFINQAGDVHSKTTVSILLGNHATLEEFLKVKKEKRIYAIVENYKGERKLVLKGDLEHKDWKVLTEFIPDDMRFKAKKCNFGFIFGKGPASAMTMDIMPNWTKKQCEDYIKDNELKTINYKEKPDVFFTVAKNLRSNFFETYFGLANWHIDTHAFAKKHGYVRSIYGCIRRLPELLAPKDDSDLGKKREANLLNVSLNSPIQNQESVVILRSMIKIQKFIKDNKLNSFFFDCIHDAMELYIHKEEISLMKKTIKQIAEEIYSEYDGIPLEVEGNVADYSKGELWDCGSSWGEL